MGYRKNIPPVHKSLTLSGAGYVGGELHSDMRHHYVGGVAYGMLGNAAHQNRIALRLVLRLKFHLVGPGRVPHFMHRT